MEASPPLSQLFILINIPLGDLYPNQQASNLYYLMSLLRRVDQQYLNHKISCFSEITLNFDKFYLTYHCQAIVSAFL